MRLLSWGDSSSPAVVSDLVLLNEVLSHIQTEQKLSSAPPLWTGTAPHYSSFICHTDAAHLPPVAQVDVAVCHRSNLSWSLCFLWSLLYFVLCIKSLGSQWQSSVSDMHMVKLTLQCNCRHYYNSSSNCYFCSTNCVHLHFDLVCLAFMYMDTWTSHPYVCADHFTPKP